MDITSTGQVSSLVPDATRPNAPAKAQPADAAATAPAGGVPQTPPSQAVTEVSSDVAATNDAPQDDAKDTPDGIDITV